MRFATDFHHGGLARSLYKLFYERLGHEIYFPDDSLASWGSFLFGRKGVWTGMLPTQFHGLGGINSESHTRDFPFLYSKEQWLKEEWDAVIATRTESIPIFNTMLKMHPNGHRIKKIYQNGNENAPIPFDYPNFLSSDLQSYNLADANHFHKLHYSQELGNQYSQPFRPVENLNVITTFTNCLPTFLDLRDALSGYSYQLYPVWEELKRRFPQKQFKSYGIICSHGMLEEIDMPAAYLEGCFTLGGKSYDGYGHSLLQSYSLGRLCVCPRGFAAPRTIGKYLRTGDTSVETEFTADVLSRFIENLDLNWINEKSLHIWNDARRLMDWATEAQRVKVWLENLK